MMGAWKGCADLFVRSISKRRADRGATNKLVKGGNGQPHLQGSGSHHHSQLGTASRVLLVAPGQEVPLTFAIRALYPVVVMELV